MQIKKKIWFFFSNSHKIGKELKLKIDKSKKVTIVTAVKMPPTFFEGSACEVKT